MQYLVAAVEFYQAHSDLIGVLFGVLLAALRVYQQTGDFRRGIVEIMFGLEKADKKGQLGPISGAALMDKAVSRIMDELVPKLPPYLRPLATQANIRRFAQWAYDQAHKYLPAPVDEAAAGREDQPEPPVEQ